MTTVKSDARIPVAVKPCANATQRANGFTKVYFLWLGLFAGQAIRSGGLLNASTPLLSEIMQRRE